jgi:hypothetical protein
MRITLLSILKLVHIIINYIYVLMLIHYYIYYIHKYFYCHIFMVDKYLSLNYTILF